MYSYTILKKEDQLTGGTKVFVEFTDGVKKVEDSVIPGDRDGFIFWVKAKIKSLEEGDNIKVDMPDGVVLPAPKDPVIVEPVLSQAEINRNIWLQKYRKWVEVKTKVIDTGIIGINHPRAVALLNDLKTTIKEEYLDYII